MDVTHELGRDERYEGFLAFLHDWGIRPRSFAEQLTAAVLCALARRVSRGEFDKALSQLPVALRDRPICHGAPTEQPEPFGRREFLERVAEHVQLSPRAVEPMVRVTFEGLRRMLSVAESHDLASQLPRDLRELWLPAAPARPLSRFEEFLHELRANPLVPPEQERQAAEAVLCTLAQRLSGGEARDLLEELPRRLRELLRPCKPQLHEPAPAVGRDAFILTVAERLGATTAQAEAITRAVFAAVRRQISPKETRDIASQLPTDLRELWGG